MASGLLSMFRVSPMQRKVMKRRLHIKGIAILLSCSALSRASRGCLQQLASPTQG